MKQDVEVEFVDVIDGDKVEPTIELAAKTLESAASAMGTAGSLLPQEQADALREVARTVGEKAGLVRETGVHVQATIDNGKKLKEAVEDKIGDLSVAFGKFGDAVSSLAGDRRFARRF